MNQGHFLLKALSWARSLEFLTNKSKTTSIWSRNRATLTLLSTLQMLCAFARWGKISAVLCRSTKKETWEHQPLWSWLSRHESSHRVGHRMIEQRLAPIPPKEYNYIGVCCVIDIPYHLSAEYAMTITVFLLVERSLPELKTFAHFVALGLFRCWSWAASWVGLEWFRTILRFNKHLANLRRGTVGLPPTLRSGHFAMQWVVPWWTYSLNNSLNQWLHHTKHLEPSCMTPFLHNSSMVEDTNLVGIPDSW